MVAKRIKSIYITCPLVCFLLFCACEKEKATPAQQAEIYYTMLINGQFEEFVRGSYGCDSLPEDYFSQRVDLVAQHVMVEQAKHGGYARFRAIKDDLLSDSTHLVYLDVAFADSTHERIVCPMIFHGDKWVMRN